MDRTYGADDLKPEYLHWWQHALREIRETSIVSWAHKVAAARAFYEPGEVSPATRKAWHKDAIEMAYGSNPQATVGGWPIVECILKSRMSFEAMMADPKRPRDLDSIRAALRDLGNPDKPAFCRDVLIKLGERMLEQG